MRRTLTPILITFSQTFSQFFLLIIIAKYYSVSQVGEFSFINALILPVSVFFSFGVRQGFVTNGDDIGYKSFLALRTIGSFLTLVILFLFVLIIDINLLTLFLSLYIVRTITMYMELQTALYQSIEKLNKVLFSQLLRYWASVFAFLLCAIFEIKFELACLVYATAHLVTFIALEATIIIASFRNDKKCISLRGQTRKYFLLGFSNFANSFQSNSSRIFLGFFSSSSALGLFSIAYQCFNVSVLFFTSVMNYFLGKNSSELKIKVSPYIFSAVIFSLSLLIGWHLLGEFFISFALSEEYNEILIPVYFLLVALAIRNIGYVFNWFLIYKEKYRVAAKFNTLMLVVSLLTSSILIYVYQLTGAYSSLFLNSIIYSLVFAIAYLKERNN